MGRVDGFPVHAVVRDAFDIEHDDEAVDNRRVDGGAD